MRAIYFLVGLRERSDRSISSFLSYLRALARSIQKANFTNNATLRHKVHLQNHLDTSVCAKPQYDKNRLSRRANTARNDEYEVWLATH